MEINKQSFQTFDKLMKKWNGIIYVLREYICSNTGLDMIVVEIDSDLKIEKRLEQYRDAVKVANKRGCKRTIIIMSFLRKEYIRYPHLDIEFNIDYEGIICSAGIKENVDKVIKPIPIKRVRYLIGKKMRYRVQYE